MVAGSVVGVDKGGPRQDGLDDAHSTVAPDPAGVKHVGRAHRVAGRMDGCYTQIKLGGIEAPTRRGRLAMTDPFSWSIDLGRWSGIRVRIHLLFVLFALIRLLGAVMERGPTHAVAETASWLALLVLALLLHELGHVAMAVRLGSEPEEIRLWPLGNLVGPAPAPLSRSPETFAVAVAGPLVSLIV